jgi:hypothetical protein
MPPAKTIAEGHTAMTIAQETRTVLLAALEGDPALTTLLVSGTTPQTLTVAMTKGVPPRAIGSTTYGQAPPFRREILVELVGRVQRLRWRRVVPRTGLLLPPTDMDLLALHGKHAHARIGLECGRGWTDLLDAVFAWLDQIAPQHPWSASQIKEKYGSLRFYWSGDLPPLGEEIIEAAEHLSSHLCDMCGAPGRIRTEQGWWTTRCAEHKR